MTTHPIEPARAEALVVPGSGLAGRRGSGLLLVDKPVGVTSHDVVARARSAAGTSRVGHAGTLDPFATGLLVLAVGHVTRLLPYLDSEPKVYAARFRFGFETDSDDATGAPTVTAAPPDWNRLPAALPSLTGTLSQTPPAYSAKHIGGERAYRKARRGESVALEPVNVVVHGWEVVAHGDSTLDVIITCGGGTYVRALARDLGRLVGSAAHCETLRRLRSGRSDVEGAVPFDALVRGAVATGAVLLQPVVPTLHDMATVVLNAEAEADVRHGRSIVADGVGERAVFVDSREAIVAIATRTAAGRWQPRVVLPPEAAA